ncbi:MAG: TRAP transporter large permease [Bacillota bacterium]
MGVSIILVLFAIFLMGIPIGFSLGIVSLIGIISESFPLKVIVQRLLIGADNYALVAIPLFILAGSLMSHGGMSRRLVEFSNALIGHWSSGLAMVSILASMFFAAITGSAIAASAAIGGLMIPLMIDEGYDARFAAPLISTAGSIGPIIPPSIPLLVYGVTTNNSVAELFMAGVVPGIIMGVALMLISYYFGKKRGYRGRETKAEFSEILKSGKSAVLALLTPIIIIGGIFSGLFTATESGVVAVVYAFLIGKLVYKELTWTKLIECLKDSVMTTGQVLIVVAMATVFTWFITFNQIPQQLAALITSVVSSKIGLLLIINAVLLFTGTFIDTVSNVVIFSPLFLPLALQFGVDPIHFGVILAVNLTIGMCTPPLGVCLFVTSSIADISIGKMMRDLIPMLIVLLIVLGIITYIPQSVLWLPNLFN